MVRVAEGQQWRPSCGDIAAFAYPGHVKELPDRWRDLGEFIREQRGISRLSLRRLSDLAGISNPYLSQIERGLRKPSAEILQSIARALRISAETLYERAGLLDSREGTSDTASAILRDPALSEDAKQTLIKVYLSLRTAPEEPAYEVTTLAGGGRGLDTVSPAADGLVLAGDRVAEAVAERVAEDSAAQAAPDRR
jgi:transcriptional regulator with XRE-family HTH domain